MAGINIEVTGISAATELIDDTVQRYRETEDWIVAVGAEYGAHVEFGTKRAQAQPYFFPSARKVMRSDFPTLERMAMNTKHPLRMLPRLIAVKIEERAKRIVPYKTGYLHDSIQAAPAADF